MNKSENHSTRGIGFAFISIALLVLSACTTLEDSTPAVTATPGTSLYDRLGGIDAITAVVDNLLVRVSKDPVIQKRFVGINLPRIKDKLILLLAEATGGPQTYDGGSMWSTHAGMDISEQEYNALIADLVSTLNELKIPDGEQLELLALLQPLKADIVVAEAATHEQLTIIEGHLKRIERKIDTLEAAVPADRKKTQKNFPDVKRAIKKDGGPKPTKWTSEEKKIVQSLIERYETASEAENGLKRRDLIGYPLSYTRFLADDGSVIDLNDMTGKPQVLFIMRGFNGMFCLQCSTQLIAITRSIKEFQKRGVPVYVIFPGDANTVISFINGVKKLDNQFRLPFSLLLDVDLVAVKEFLVEGSLAKPTTMILDDKGIVRWVYVGKQASDRPSVTTVIKQLDNLMASP